MSSHLQICKIYACVADNISVKMTGLVEIGNHRVRYSCLSPRVVRIRNTGWTRLSDKVSIVFHIVFTFHKKKIEYQYHLFQ